MVEQEAQTQNPTRVFFNPFVFTDEQNQKFLAAGYEVMPLRVPPADEMWVSGE